MSFSPTRLRPFAQSGWGGRAQFRSAVAVGWPGAELPSVDPQILGTSRWGQLGTVVYRAGVGLSSSLVGVTRDSNGVAVGSVRVELFLTAGDLPLMTAVSDTTGNFNFNNPGTGPFYIVAYKAGSPDLAGTTVNTLRAGAAADTPTQPLRFASPTNFVPQGFNTSDAVKRHVISRQIHYIGSGDMSELRLLLLGWANGGSAISTPGNAVTYANSYICKELAASGINVKFGGSNSVTVYDGQLAVISDPILPSQFGLSKFTRGERYDVTIDLPFAAGGIAFPQYDNMNGAGSGQSYDSGFFGLICDPGTTTYDNINSFGSINWTGPDVGVLGGQVACILLGKFVSGDPGTYLGIGDSIVAGVGATSAAGEGKGSFFTRSLFPTEGSPSLNPVAGCNAGFSGGISQVWLNTSNASQMNLASLAKYANRVIEEYGINSIGSAGGSGAAAGIVADCEAIYKLVRTAAPVANGSALKIMRTSLLCKTNFPSTTPSAGCGVADTLDYFNQQMLAAAGAAPGPDSFVSARDVIVSSTTPATTANYLWASGMTDDGVHPSEAGHAALAAAGGVRAWVLANL